MRNRKGIAGAPGFLIFTLVVALSVSVLYIITVIPLVNDVVRIRSEAVFEVSINDRGTALAALLNASTGGVSYAEALGSQAAAGVPDGLDDSLEAALNNMKPAGKVAIYDRDGGSVKKKYNADLVTGSYVWSDLALPGLKKGEVRVI